MEGSFFVSSPLSVLHRLDTFVRLRLMGMKGKVESKPLSEERAVEMGSEIIGEAFLYSVAAAYIVFEYWRSTRKDKRHEEVQNREISDLHSQTQRLEGQVAQLQVTLESLKTELRTHLENGNVVHIVCVCILVCSQFMCTSQITVTFDLAHVVIYILHGLCTCSSSRHHPHIKARQLSFVCSTRVFMRTSHHSLWPLRDHRVHDYSNNDRSSSSNQHSDKPSSWWTWRS